MRAQRVTGQDVAERAGVSRATVSYVLNDVAGQPISAETRARVLAAAGELGYAPHAAARQLRTGVSDLVLVALPPWPMSHALSTGLAAGSRRMSELGYTPLVDLATQGSGALEQTLMRLQPVALAAGADQLHEALVHRLRATGTRIVLAVSDRPLDYVPSVVFDQAAITRTAIDHLAARGRRNIMVLMPEEPALHFFRLGRQVGAVERAEQLGLRSTVVTAQLDQDQVAAAVTKALNATLRPDAILAYNDDFALLALRTLLDLNVDVPGEVAVVGCDDTPVAQLFKPQLTTVNIEPETIGVMIADAMHKALQGGELPDTIPAPTPVIVARDST